MTTSRVHVLGGLNEIGGNKFLVEEGEERVLLDFGTALGTRSDFFDGFLKLRNHSALRDLLRLDQLPKIDGLYREDLLAIAKTRADGDLPESATSYEARTGSSFVHGVLLTHAHVDHFQDIAFLDPGIPIYCSPTTKAMLEAVQVLGKTTTEKEVIEARPRELDRRSDRATFSGLLEIDRGETERDIRAVEEESWFDVGPFRAYPVPVDHSVPGACAFLLETPSEKRVFYTGDIRFHGRLEDRTRSLRSLAEGLEPDLLLTEGTRVMSDQTDDEDEVEREVKRLTSDADGLVISEFAWKDTTRFDTLQRVAEATGRTLLVDPRLAFVLRKLADRPDVPSQAVEDYTNVRTYLRRTGGMLYSPMDYSQSKHATGYEPGWSASDVDEVWEDGDEEGLRTPLAHFGTGLRAADVRKDPGSYIVHLSYWRLNELFDLAPPEGSRWIQCSTEPFSEEMELEAERQERWMDEFGLSHNVTEEGELQGAGPTHVSGHIAGVDLLPFVDSIEAATVVPIHTAAAGLDEFVDAGLDPTIFPGRDYRDAARGDVVIEF